MSETDCTGVSATVISLQPSHVQLAVQSVNACQQCLKGRGCGLGLNRSGKSQVTLALSEIRITDQSGRVQSQPVAELLHPGNKVSIRLPRPQLMGFILKALFAPAALLILMAAIGHHLAQLASISADIGAVAGLMVAVAGGLILARNCNYKHERKNPRQYQAQLILPLPSQRNAYRQP